MGYYTNYTGDVLDSNGNWDYELEEQIAHAVAQLPYFDSDDKSIVTLDDVIATQAEKWYDYIEDMKNISLQFPDATIVIHGQGENYDDIWNTYFQNGKYARYEAEIIIPSFNPADLQL